MKQTRSRRLLSPRTQKLIRRLHMYSGLALVPWVLLYGWTAMLFNHGSWISPWERSEVGRGELMDAGWNVSDPTELTRAMIDQLTARVESADAALELVEGSVRTIGSYRVEGRRADRRFRLRVSATASRAFLDTAPARVDEVPLPQWIEGSLEQKLTPEVVPDEAILKSARAALALDPESDVIRIRRHPRVECLVRDHTGSEYEVTIPLDPDGEVRIERAGAASTMRSKLLRLHLQHGDPGSHGSRWLWFLIVDAMGVAMMVWAVSGIVMWWAIKKTRRAGGIALAVGVGTIGVLALGVWAAAGL